MFKASNLGSVEGMECFSLAGDADLRRYLIDHLDTVQLAAVSGMPQGSGSARSMGTLSFWTAT